MTAVQLINELVRNHKTIKLNNKEEIYTLINYLSVHKDFDAKGARELNKIYFFEKYPKLKVEDNKLKLSNDLIYIDSGELAVKHLFDLTVKPMYNKQYYIIQSLVQENLFKRALRVSLKELIIYKENTSVVIDAHGNIIKDFENAILGAVDLIPIWQAVEVKSVKLNTFDLFDLDKYYTNKIIYKFDGLDYDTYRKNCYNIIDKIVELRNTSSTELYYIDKAFKQNLVGKDTIGIKLSGLFTGKYKSLTNDIVEQFSPTKNQTTKTHIIRAKDYSSDNCWVIANDMMLKSKEVIL